ncbi:ectoine hydroxylase-related dioxygenase (phytanoyl-CoA dioxygenase family) [Rhodoligotrophos appendicifer]|uniref:phytanoyl-CoA dioxygenase family protein n=1 Tax=Rhodoligotrophos appendicifer TaxID=987056 RepID=UPI0011849CA7|nr:phytanoyl-CoA dioxygenase family protein [Rhodoligotrophos appendicifer]
MSNISLSSNGIALPNIAQYVGHLAETTAHSASDGLAKEHFNQNGYLLMREVADRDDVLDVREAYLRLFDRSFVKDGDFRRGEYSGQPPVGLPKHGFPGHPAHAFVRSQIFYDFVNSESFQQLAEDLLGGPALRVRRTPLRHFIRGQKAASRAHIDRTYIDSRKDDFVTLWIPLGDCPIEAGGLVYLEGSHRDHSLTSIKSQTVPTDRPDDSRPITHDLKWMSDVTGNRWLVTNYRAGDVIAHSPEIVHASLDSASDMMRISTDIRFIRAGKSCDPRWQQDWSADDGY